MRRGSTRLSNSPGTDPPPPTEASTWNGDVKTAGTNRRCRLPSAARVCASAPRDVPASGFGTKRRHRDHLTVGLWRESEGGVGVKQALVLIWGEWGEITK